MPTLVLFVERGNRYLWLAAHIQQPSDGTQQTGSLIHSLLRRVVGCAQVVTDAFLQFQCGGGSKPHFSEFKKLRPHSVRIRCTRTIDAFLSVLTIFGCGVHSALPHLCRCRTGGSTTGSLSHRRLGQEPLPVMKSILG